MTDGRFRHLPVMAEGRDGRADLDRRRGQGAPIEELSMPRRMRWKA
ncbi:MAG: hypothetical protein MZV49_24915 [Rhodopseudomonas palustris]|nr:hypothetical protein [Rhodopseudomonas palustris]